MSDSQPTCATQSYEPEIPTVLLVDDDCKILRGLERHLEDQSFRIITAVSPAEAHGALTTENVDLIVSDNMMTGTLGTEFLKTVHLEYPEIKLMLLSGYVSPATAERMISDHGIDKVLTKPCDAAVVADAIHSLLSPAHSMIE